MKNLKKILLLGIMLVNLMPYLKEGKVELKSTEVAAQYYTIEDTGLGIYICGEYDNPEVTLISKIPCSMLKPENVDTDDPIYETCYCGVCGLQKSDCDLPCPECQNIVTVNADGKDFKTGGTICSCLCGAVLSSCSVNGVCTDPYCAFMDQKGSITSNQPSTQDQKIYTCIQEFTYKYGMDIYPISSGQGFSAGHNNWCSVMTLASILGSLDSENICNGPTYYDPRTIAQYYVDHFNRDIINDTLGVLAIDQAKFYNDYSKNNICINEQIISHDGCNMYDAVKANSNSGIIVAQSKADTGMGSGHTLLFYEFFRNLNDSPLQLREELQPHGNSLG
jgi:hypothetical protein